jgi:hypothetical protein
VFVVLSLNVLRHLLYQRVKVPQLKGPDVPPCKPFEVAY